MEASDCDSFVSFALSCTGRLNPRVARVVSVDSTCLHLHNTIRPISFVVPRLSLVNANVCPVQPCV
eukprot:5686875-Pleurochrysis_carterae.AAC.1